jgi:hypothetical protein
MAQMPDHSYSSRRRRRRPTALQLLAIHNDLLATSSPPSFAPRRLQLRTGRRSARSVIWGELLVRHAVDVAPSPNILCKAPSRHDALVLRSCGAAQEGVYGSGVPVGRELLKCY